MLTPCCAPPALVSPRPFVDGAASSSTSPAIFFLTRDWPRYCSVPLRGYVAARLAEIQRALQAHPTPLCPLVDRLLAEEGLLANGTRDGLRLTFERIAHRSPAAAVLCGAEREIERQQDALQTAFDEFYPQLLARFGVSG